MKVLDVKMTNITVSDCLLDMSTTYVMPLEEHNCKEACNTGVHAALDIIFCITLFSKIDRSMVGLLDTCLGCWLGG